MLGIIKTVNGQKKVIPLTADVGAGNPVGTIIPMYKKSNPSGYLYCDGSTFDETKYPLLYAYLGSNVLPDYREFALVGAEQNTTSSNIATHDVYTEGQEKDDQLQAHMHGMYIGNTLFDQAPNSTSTSGSGLRAFNNAGSGSAIRAANILEGRNGTVTRGKRKAVYFYIKATSGLSENQQDNVINTLNEQRSYSTEEHLTGKKWIDGKPIYRKVVDFGALPNNTIKGVAHNISNLGFVVDIKGISYTTNDGGNYITIPNTGISSTSYSYFMYVTSMEVRIQTGQDRTNYTKTYVTLEYTKTT